MNNLLSNALQDLQRKSEEACAGLPGVQADLPGSSTNMESVSPYTTRAFHLSLASTMRMAFSRVSLADCSTADTSYGINHTSHIYFYHVFVADTLTVLTATAYWLFHNVWPCQHDRDRGAVGFDSCKPSTMHGWIAAALQNGGRKLSCADAGSQLPAITLPNTRLHNIG